MENYTDIPDHILEHLIARESGRLSQEDRRLLDDFFDANPALKPLGDDYVQLIHQARHLDVSQGLDHEKAWVHISRQSTKPAQNASLTRQTLKYAAILLPLVAAMGFWFLYQDTGRQAEDDRAEVMASARERKATLVLGSGESYVLDESAVGATIEKEGASIHQEDTDRIRYTEATQAIIHSLQVPRGGEYELVLPDGTIALINSDSRLDYPTMFDLDQREVTLSGEAYFEVASDTDRPFVVNTPDMQITVTGTAFNMHNYPGDVAEATLVSGRLSVASGDAEAVTLQPGEQARKTHDTGDMTVEEVDVDLYTSWVHGMFSFRDLPLADLSVRMQRWYDVDIEIADEEAGNIRLTGAMEKDKTVDYLVRLIEQSANVSFSVKAQKMVVSMDS